MSAFRRSASGSARRLVIALVALTAMTCLLSGPAASSAAAAAPEDNLAPEVVGAGVVGERLVCGAGSWSGGVEEFKYEWLREGTVIASATSSVYTVTTADRGRLLSCIVTARNSEGEEWEESSNSVFVEGEHETPPENKTPPEVSGTPAVGKTLSCSNGTWSGSPPLTYTYEWLRDGAGIASATESTYTVTEADESHSLSCEVTATNKEASVPKESKNSVHVPGSPPKITGEQPKVLGNPHPEVGNTLTCSHGEWSGAPTFKYQWLREKVSIASATASTYTVESADQLHSLSCKVTATNSEGSAEAISSNSLGVKGSAPKNIIPPAVEGTPKVGDTLTCSPGEWSGAPTPTYTYKWLLDEVSIGSAKTSSYIVKAEDRGHSLSCEVTAENSEGPPVPATSARVVVPQEEPGDSPPRNTEPPYLRGNPAKNETLTCERGKWSGKPEPTYTYQWLRDGTDILHATKNSYTVAEADRGHSLSCEVTAENSEGNATAGSDSLHVPGEKPVNTGAPWVSSVSQEPEVGETLTCSPGTWSGAPPPTTYKYQWLRDGTSIPSATASSHIVATEDRGYSLSCQVTAENSEGASSETSSNFVHVPGEQPKNTEPPQVSGSTEPAVGESLTCSSGKWSGAPTPTYTYQWLLNGANIPSATASSYVVLTADQGRSLSCKVTATNSEGTESATSKSVRVPGDPPENTEVPQVSGPSVVGETLTCSRGAWNGKPPPTFTYQWRLDGTEIASATASTYTVELADQGQLLSCMVTATNIEGHAEAESYGVEISSGATKTEPKPEAPDPKTFDPPAQPTATASQVLASLGTELTRAQRGARIVSLLKDGYYWFSFAAPAPGTLELFWYEVPKGAHVSAKSKPVLVAQATVSFASARTTAVKLRLTSRGRQLIRHGKHIALTAKGVFIRSGESTVTWLKAFVLSR